jgi:glycosyltransferase involved in cell wall biosynthesis
MDKLMERYIDSRYDGVIRQKFFIPVGIPEYWFVKKNFRILKDQEVKVISSVGHVISVRNRICLVKAFFEVLKSFPNLRIDVVGEVYIRDCVDLAVELGIADKVHFHGTRDTDFVRELLENSSLEAHDLEGIALGTASLEGLATGTPVIASVQYDNFKDFDLRDIPNLVLISPNDVISLRNAMVEILNNPENYIPTQESTEKLRNYFGIQSVVKRHLEAANSIVQVS